MSSKRRLRKNGCTGKIRHPTQGGAYVHLKKLLKARLKTEYYDVYKCRFCRGWHIGRPPQK